MPQDEFGIQSAADLAASTAPSILIFGEPGTGKTTLAATAKGKKLFIELNETGISSVADNPDIQVVRIKSFTQFNDFINKLDKVVTKYQFNAIIIDTVNGLQELFLSETSNAKAGKQPSQQDYGTWNTKISGIMSFLKQNCEAWGITLIFIGHQKNDAPNNEDGQTIGANYRVALTHTPAQKLHAICDNNIKLEIRKIPQKDANGKIVLDPKNGTAIYNTIRYAILGNSDVNQVKIRTTREDVKAMQTEIALPNPTIPKILSLTKPKEAK